MPKKLKFGVNPGWEFGDRQLTPLLVEVVEFELERQPGGDDAPELESLYEVNKAEAISSPN